MTAPVASTWSVTSQTPSTQVVGNRGALAGYEIMFTTGDGHTGSVWVEDAKYNPDNVKALITAKAAQLDSVGALTSDS